MRKYWQYQTTVLQICKARNWPEKSGGSHSRYYDPSSLLRCGILWLYQYLQAFWTNVMPSPSGSSRVLHVNALRPLETMGITNPMTKHHIPENNSSAAPLWESHISQASCLLDVMPCSWKGPTFQRNLLSSAWAILSVDAAGYSETLGEYTGN